MPSLHLLSVDYEILIESHKQSLAELAGEDDVMIQEIDEIQHELRRLRQRLDELRKKRETITTTRARLESGLPGEERGLALRALEDSYQELIATSAYWCSVERLSRAIEDFKSQYPELPMKLKDYEQLEANRQQIEQLPLTYREQVLREHQKLANQLQPYQGLIARRQSLEPPSTLTLNIAILETQDKGTIWWVVPYRHDDGLSSEVSDVLCDVVWELVNQIANLSREPNWVFDDVSVDSWQGYDALVTQGAYEGAGSPADDAAAYLRNRLPELAVFTRFVPSIDVGLLPTVLRVPVLEEDVEATPQAAIDDLSGTMLEELTGGLYTTDDVRSWAAPLDVGAKSLWNQQARRLRTLLIRLIGRGCVGEDGVPRESLSQHLPNPHQQYLQVGIERMLETDVLVHRMRDGDDSVALNPDRIAEAQSLINREVTPFWAGIVAASE